MMKHVLRYVFAAGSLMAAAFSAQAAPVLSGAVATSQAVAAEAVPLVAKVGYRHRWHGHGLHVSFGWGRPIHRTRPIFPGPVFRPVYYARPIYRHRPVYYGRPAYYRPVRHRPVYQSPVYHRPVRYRPVRYARPIHYRPRCVTRLRWVQTWGGAMRQPVRICRY